MLRTLLVLAAGAVIWSGCVRRQPDYFPLVSGAVRVMKVRQKVTTPSGTGETTFVAAVEVVRGERDLPQMGRVWVVESPADSARFFYRRSGDSIFEIQPGRGGRPKPVLYLLLPLRVGKRWHDTGAEEAERVVEVLEDVAVPLGRFADCYRVVTTHEDFDMKVATWFAPGVGVVRRERRLSWGADSLRREVERVEELVEYRLPKQE